MTFQGGFVTGPDPSPDFHVVGVGASAGGLDALEKFFSHAPADSGLAIIIIQHLSPDYKSLMADLLSKRTDMPVHVAEDGMSVEANHVYLIPPRQSLTIFHRKLYLTERESGQLYLPIDIFFQSLADDLGEKAVGVILSGTGSDGTRGIRAIKEKGGLAIVQDEQSAKFDGMPRSAIATNLVDYVLPPEHMVREILNYVQHPCLVNDPLAKRAIAQDEDTLSKVFALLRSSSGVDFTHYKQSTMVRRIERRMGIKQMEKLSDYLHYLYQSPTEVNTLYREFLIGVTRFFRDPEVFERIRADVIPAIFANKMRGESIRMWVAGCSTGEEAYSLAILLTEYMETTGRHMDVKVFATDLDKNALEFAGKGIYPESIAADISSEHLQNYFIKSGDSYTVTRRIREMVIFAQQNIIIDPPFSKVDLISCRNVLIYLQSSLQKKVISAFQFSLNPDGFLILGTSETIGEAEDFFHCRDVKLKIYQYKGGFRPALGDSRLTRMPNVMQPPVNRYSTVARDDWRAVDNIQRGLLQAFLPPVAVVDENSNLIYTVGDLDAYLRVPSGGVFTPNILKQAREGLSIPLSTAIHKVLNDQEMVTYKNIRVGEGDNGKMIDMMVKPFVEPGTRQKLALIQFNPVLVAQTETQQTPTYDLASSAQQRIQDLEHELQYTRESLQATVEELETSNEELQATNEELFAANEELQSTNEELHSVNEELITVNAEYHAKIQELTRLNEDINNLLSSTDVGTLFLDMDLRVRLFTPPTQKEFHLLIQDIGRPLSHVTHNLVGCDLIYEANQVLKTLAVHEMQVQTTTGCWYQMKLIPYYTLQHQVGGVVLTFIDVSELQRANHQLARLSAAVEQSTQLKMIVRMDGTIEYVNPRVTHATLYTASELLDRPWHKILSEKADAQAIAAMQSVFQTGETWAGEMLCLRKGAADFWAKITLSPIRDAQGNNIAILLAAEDITARRKMEETLKQQANWFQFITDAVISTDNHLQITGWNDAAVRIYGYSVAEAMGAHIDNLLKTEFVNTTQPEAQATLLKDGLWHGQLKQRTKNGDMLYLDASVTFLKNNAGEIVGGITINRDVTERRKLDETLRVSEQRYRFLVSVLPDTAILLFDKENRYLVAGGEELERTGFDTSKIEGHTLAEVFPPDLVELFTPLYARALKGESIAFEHAYGPFAYHQTIEPIRNDAGEVEAGLLVAHNVTDRAHFEKELQTSLAKYRILFELAPYGITVADRDGKILESNREAERILGISKETHASRNIDGAEWTIIRPDGSLMSAEEYASVRALKENRQVEGVMMGIVKSAENIAWISVTAVPLGDYGVLVTYHEIADKPADASI
jgi:two-component system CheB/CheR fusion protein